MEEVWGVWVEGGGGGEGGGEERGGRECVGVWGGRREEGEGREGMTGCGGEGRDEGCVWEGGVWERCWERGGGHPDPRRRPCLVIVGDPCDTTDAGGVSSKIEHLQFFRQTSRVHALLTFSFLFCSRVLAMHR